MGIKKRMDIPQDSSLSQADSITQQGSIAQENNGQRTRGQKIADALLWFTIMSLFTFSIVYMLACTLGLEFEMSKLAVIIALSIGLWSLILMNRFTFFGALILSLLSGAGYGLLLYKNQQLEPFMRVLLENSLSFAKWSIQTIQGNLFSHAVYTSYFMILLGVLVALVVYIFTIKKFSFLLLFIGGGFLFVFEVAQKLPINGFALYLFAFSSLIYFFKSRYLTLKQSLDENNSFIYGAFMKMGLLAGIIIVISAALVANKYPYKAQFWHDLVNTLSKREYYYIADTFSVQSAGLQENTVHLGGDINPNDIPVLEVKALSPTYLKAMSRSIYTGNSWQKDPAISPNLLDANMVLEDTEEMLEGVKWLSGEDNTLNRLFYKNSATIRFLNINTKSLFIPVKMQTFTIKSANRDVFVSHKDSFSLEKKAGKNFTYEVEFYEPKYTNDNFRETLRKSKIGFYSNIKEEYPEDRTSINAWEAVAEQITKTYTQLPEDLPDRVKELAKTITKDKDNNYDKVKAIEEYLMANYEYTLTPGEVNPTHDFVDEFLFEGKQGYCTYFASAQAILTRCLGIPCRYVEGYILPRDRDKNSKSYLVTNKRAHAWVEVYFEGVGWIIIEATPPYRQAEIQPQTLVSMEEAMRMGQANNMGTYAAITPQNVTREAEHPALMVIGIAIFGFVSIIAFVMILYCYRKHKRNKMPSRALILYLYEKQIKLLSQLKLSMKGGETETAFALRVEDYLFIKDNCFQEMTALYLVARYSQLDISDEDKQKMLESRWKLLEKCKGQMSPVKYMACRTKYRFL